MAKKSEQDNVEPQSQSQTGGTPQNPNADVADGNQSTISPGAGGNPAGGTYGGQSVPSDGGNPAANQGGANGAEGGESAGPASTGGTASGQ